MTKTTKMLYVNFLITLCLAVLFVGVATAGVDDSLDVPVSKISQIVGAPTLKFLYW